MEWIVAAVGNADTLAAREGGLASVTALCKEIGTSAAPFMTPFLSTILTAYADKVTHSTPYLQRI